jgi:hypothetical protein
MKKVKLEIRQQGPQGRHENIAMERAEFQKVVEKKYMKHRAHMRRRFCSKIWVDS